MPNITLTDGFDLYYEDQGSGRPIVLLHGFCGSSSYFESVMEPLSRTWRVIAPDWRGHGKSGAPDGVYTMEALAGDLAVLLDRLEVDKAVVFGHSLGGYAAIAFAEAYGEKVKALGLIHSTSQPDTEEGKEKRLKGIQSIKERGIRPFVDGLIPNLFAPAHVEKMKKAIEEVKQIGYAASPEGAAATLEGMRIRPDRSSVLASASFPVLLVAGTEDRVISPEKTFSVRGEHVKRAKIDNAAHMSMYESPDRLLRILQSFLETAWK
jgi:3-oxoadipate enol-lactonase